MAAATKTERVRVMGAIEVVPPSWRTAVTILMGVLVNGSSKGVEEASREITRCASIADACGPFLAIVQGERVAAVLTAEERTTVAAGVRLLERAGSESRTPAAMKG